MLLAPKKNNPNYDETIGCSRGTLSTKIYYTIGGLRNPVDFILTAGQVHDSKYAEDLLKVKKVGFVIADKAFN